MSAKKTTSPPLTAYLAGHIPDEPLIRYGKGSWYWEGEEKILDFTSGIFTNSFGHADPELTQALASSFSRLANIHGRHFEEEAEIYKKLFVYLPDKGYRVIPYGDGGGYTIDRALVELYYHFGKRPFRLAAFAGGFHGKTQATKLCISRTQDSTFFSSHLVPEPDCGRCPCHQKPGKCSLECIDLTKTVLKDSHADVFLFEPVPGARVVIPPAHYWEQVQAFCREEGILMMADEVLTGGGRTGRFLACDHYGLHPDILILTKGLANGLPLSLLLLREELTQNPFSQRSGNFSSTFVGVPALLSVLSKVLDKLEEEHILENVTIQGERLRQHLSAMTRQTPVLTRSLGFMGALEFRHPDGTPDEKTGRAVYEAAHRNGLALIGPGSVLRLAPPLNLSSQEMDIGLELLEKSLKEVLS